MKPQYQELIEAYVAGDVIAIALVDQCLSVVADIGFVRSSDGEDLARADIEYFEVRAEMDEEIDNIAPLFSHFNIKSGLQEHCEGLCSCDDEQVFEKSSCGCGECDCGNGDALIIKFPPRVPGDTNE